MAELTAGEFYAALNATRKDFSAMSWGGFNLFGDAKSIKEASRLLHEAGKVSELIDIIKAERALTVEQR